MTTIYSASRAALVVLSFVFVAACGGGGDDRDSIPAGAKVCQLKDWTPPSHGVPDFDNLIHSDDDDFTFLVKLVDGGTRYAVSNWQPFYVLVSTWPDRSPYGLVEEALTVPANNKRAVLYYSNYLGTLNGRHVSGEHREALVIGSDSMYVEDQVTPEEVGGIKLPDHGGAWPNDPHVMSKPGLIQLDRHLFRVEEGLYQATDWSRLSNATIEIEVFTDSETGNSGGYQLCEIRGLTESTNTVVITGGRSGGAYWVMTRTYAPLDAGIKAYSSSVYARFEY